MDPAARGRPFSHFVCRVAGLPAACLEELAAVRSIARHDLVCELEARCAELGESLVAELFEAVEGLDEKTLRAALLELKRDVHNLRSLRAAPLSVVSKSGLPSGLLADLRCYQATVAEREEALRRFAKTFDEELPELRRRFQTLVEDEDFQKGLLLSSRTLFDELRRFTRAPARRPGAKARQVERSLMRYFSRTVMKTTPFGTFCAVVPGRFVAGTEAPAAPAFDGEPRRKTSLLRLNKATYLRLVRHLSKRPAVRRKLSVELNPTLRSAGGEWVFLTATDGRELFQRMAPNPVLDLLREVLAEAGHLPVEALVDAFLDLVEASREEASAYVDRLLEVGFLRFRLGIREQEVRWDGPLGELIAPIDDDHARRAAAFLEAYRRNADAYAAAPIGRRRDLLAATESLVENLFEDLGAERETEDGPLPAAEKTPFFEDAAGAASLALELGELGGLLAEWVELTSPLATIRGEQANMRHFFESFYGSETGAVPLLEFYEDYYREHFKEHSDRVRRAGAAQGRPAADAEEAEGPPGEDEDLSNPFRLELVERLAAARKRLGERIAELRRADPAAPEIVLERRDLEEATAALPPLADPCRSVSLFVHYLPALAPGGADALVANTYFTGFGKYFSRFLYLLPEEVKADLVEANRAGDDEVAEICADAGFNANLHPPLLPFEICYPTGEGGVTERQVKTSDLVVEPDPERPYRLRLRRAGSAREVLPVDLGFLNPLLRPPLYQLLSRMTPATMFRLDVPDDLGSPEKESPHEVAGRRPSLVHRPRVTYRGRLILARRRWTIASALFPRRRPQERESDYFLRIQDWRRELGLPAEVFVRIAPSAPTGPAAAEDRGERAEARRLRRHLHKPQYVDFANPFLVDLFSRSAENLDEFRMTLEERLPGREHLIPGGGERWATELVVQLDFPPREV